MKRKEILAWADECEHAAEMGRKYERGDHGKTWQRRADFLRASLAPTPEWVVEAEGPPGEWTQIGLACPSNAKADDLASFHRRKTGERTRVIRVSTTEAP